MTALGRIALDGEEVPAPANGDDWRMAWHPPPSPPAGQPHGANAFCVTADGEVVLISPDGQRWGWPGGRPEPGESWEQTLRREILEEACATVTRARLLGFVRGRCVSGREQGLVLVRSIWRAEVTLRPWRPEHEIPFRRTVPASDLAGQLWIEPGAGPIYARAAQEAGLTLPTWPWFQRAADALPDPTKETKRWPRTRRTSSPSSARIRWPTPCRSSPA